MKQRSGGVVWNYSVAETITQVIRYYGVVHQRIVCAVQRSKVGFERAVVTTTIGTGGLENLLVEIREGTNREFGGCFLRFSILHFGIRVEAFLLASCNEQQHNE
jgi:hypothetical protein